MISPTETSSSQLPPSPAPAASSGAHVGQQQLHQHSLLSGLALTPRSDASSAPGTSAAAAAAPPSVPLPVVPAVVRLLSHKVNKRPYEAVVLAQVLEGSTGVAWVVAVSQDGAFLATAGQDCILRVWQLTASRCAVMGSET